MKSIKKAIACILLCCLSFKAHGADLDQSALSHLDNLLLLNASFVGDHAMVELLLDAGADPNYTDSKFFSLYSPLMLAAYCRHPQVARMLLQRGALVNKQRTSDQATALCIVLGGQKTEYYKGIETVFRRYDLVRLLDTYRFNRDFLRRLEKYGGRVAVYAALYQTPRDEPDQAHHEFIELVLKAGADPNISDRNGRTALSMILEREDLVYALLSSESDMQDPEKLKAIITHGIPTLKTCDLQQLSPEYYDKFLWYFYRHEIRRIYRGFISSSVVRAVYKGQIPDEMELILTCAYPWLTQSNITSLETSYAHFFLGAH